MPRPSAVIIVRHGERADDVPTEQHAALPPGVQLTPLDSTNDPPLSQRGKAAISRWFEQHLKSHFPPDWWSQGPAAAAAATSTEPGNVFDNGQKRRVRIMCSPFLRTVETATGIMQSITDNDVDKNISMSFDLDNELCEVFGPIRIKGGSEPTLENGRKEAAWFLSSTSTSTTKNTTAASGGGGTMQEGKLLPGIGTKPRWNENIHSAHSRFQSVCRRYLSVGSDSSSASSRPQPSRAAAPAYTSKTVWDTHGDDDGSSGASHQTMHELDPAIAAMPDLRRGSPTASVGSASSKATDHASGEVVILVTHGDCLQAAMSLFYPHRTVYECDYLGFIVLTPAAVSAAGRTPPGCYGGWKAITTQGMQWLEEEGTGQPLPEPPINLAASKSNATISPAASTVRVEIEHYQRRSGGATAVTVPSDPPDALYDGTESAQLIARQPPALGRSRSPVGSPGASSVTMPGSPTAMLDDDDEDIAHVYFFVAFDPLEKFFSMVFSIPNVRCCVKPVRIPYVATAMLRGFRSGRTTLMSLWLRWVLMQLTGVLWFLPLVVFLLMRPYGGFTDASTTTTSTTTSPTTTNAAAPTTAASGGTEPAGVAAAALGLIVDQWTLDKLQVLWMILGIVGSLLHICLPMERWIHSVCDRGPCFDGPHPVPVPRDRVSPAAVDRSSTIQHSSSSTGAGGGARRAKGSGTGGRNDMNTPTEQPMLFGHHHEGYQALCHPHSNLVGFFAMVHTLRTGLTLLLYVLLVLAIEGSLYVSAIGSFCFWSPVSRKLGIEYVQPSAPCYILGQMWVPLVLTVLLYGVVSTFAAWRVQRWFGLLLREMARNWGGGGTPEA